MEIRPHEILELENSLSQLSEIEADELIKINQDTLRITERGHPFVRNVCMPFDLRLQRKKPETKLFSMTI